MSTLIIAEAGVNHNGDLDTALQLVDVAAASGADYVKFQTFRASSIASEKAEKAEYQRRSTGETESQLRMLERLELSAASHEALLARCREKEIGFLSTAFDLPSLDLLLSLGIDLLKIPSGEITNAFMLERVAAEERPVILSTGMSSIEEIEAAVGLLLESGLPREALTLLQCTTEYPAPFENVNLRCMDTLRRKFDVKVGLSDHTVGWAVSVAAVALGAEVIEKHFTLNRGQPGPDHAASLEPTDLAAMITAIRQVESSLGSPAKVPGSGELANRQVARKSLHLQRPLAAGAIVEREHLSALRPGDGISPMAWTKVVGRRAVRSLEAGHKLSLDDLTGEA